MNADKPAAFPVSVHRRKLIQQGAALAGTSLLPFAPRVLAQGGGNQPYKGTTINVSCWSATYPKLIQEYLPDFEAQTGIKVNYDLPGFPVFNQRADLELSVKGSSYDVLNLTFIYIARWIGAGWFTPLSQFINDPKHTPADFDYKDLLPAAVSTLSDSKGEPYAIPWTADAQIMAAARGDLLDEAGLKFPGTLDEFSNVLKVLKAKGGPAPFATENVYHWTYVPFLYAMGGKVFRGAPGDLFPLLNSPEAIASADYFASIMQNYAPDGVMSYNFDQVIASQKQSKTNLSILNHAYLTALGQGDSPVAKTVRYGWVPGGKAGRFPQVAVHGWGIPVGSKKKEAAWEFIKWSMSKSLLQRMLKEKGYAALTRASTLETPQFKSAMMVNGQDLGKLYLDVVDSSKDGHMAYRTVHVFPQTGQQINKAIGAIISKQMTAKDAMNLAQENLLADLKRAGVKV
ncbi:MAG: extracellular solute-binding protein [Burkholderiaceae bacterium]